MTQPLAQETSPPPFAGDYRAAALDEMIGADGRVQPHWQALLDGLDRLGPESRLDLAQRIDMRVRETGLSHDQFADPSRRELPWRLNLMPIVISAAEWRSISAAVVQRARLATAIADDIYGPQRMMRRDLLPAGLVFNDPAYLRPCHGIGAGLGRLQFFAVDLAREASGAWRVVDTHAETPAGIGYALANRSVLRHVCGDLLDASRVMPLVPFFTQMQDALAARVDRADPTIVLLSPGHGHDDFFGHAYLARYLGMLLAEGSDLKVDKGRVFLKTLEGLEQIDLVVRCVPGAASDPLELDPSGFLGPVGLMQAVRRQPGLIVNAPGTAIVENRGLGAYLPGLCHDLLGEALMVPDAERLWLGWTENRRRVAADPDAFFIRKAFEGTARPGLAARAKDAARMTPGERQALLAEIERRGDLMVAEAKTQLATAPAFDAKGLVPAPFVMRVFATATPDGFVVMPGGLAMTVDPGASSALTSLNGEVRDVWIASDQPLPPFRSLWRPLLEAAQVQRAPRETPSRAADNMFWLGRTVEHADWVLRLARISLGHAVAEGEAQETLVLAGAILRNFLNRGREEPVGARPSPVGSADVAQLVRVLLSSPDNDHAWPRTLAEIARLANQTRDRLSHEAWQTLHRFETAPGWTAERTATTTAETFDRIDQGLRFIAAFNGLSHENMTRNPAWSFLDMGRRVARAINAADMLGTAFGKARADEGPALLFALELSDSFITYRSRYRLIPNLALVLDLLLLDETNPRSLAFQVSAIARHIATLSPNDQRRAPNKIEGRALGLLNDLRFADPAALVTADADGNRRALAALLQAQSRRLTDLVDAMTRRYFNVGEPAPRWSRATDR